MTKPTGKPRGRPPVPPQERTRSRPWAVNPKLHERVEADAKAEDVTVSEWLRDAAERKLRSSARRSMELKDRLKAARKASIDPEQPEEHLTQRRVAEILKIDQITVSRWERGKATPDRDTVATLAKLYGVTPASLEIGEVRTEATLDRSTAQEMPTSWVEDMEWAIKAAELDETRAQAFREKRRSIGFAIGRTALFALANDAGPTKVPDRAIADTPRSEVIFDVMGEIEKKKR